MDQASMIAADDTRIVELATDRELLIFDAIRNDAVNIIRVLLATPGFNVNVSLDGSLTPFQSLCVHNGSLEVFKVFLSNERVDLLPKIRGVLPIFYTLMKNRIDVIRWWIAYGREITLNGDYTYYKMVQLDNGTHITVPLQPSAEIIRLLDDYRADPLGAQHRVRRQLGLTEELAADWFAVIIFVADGLLAMKGQDKESKTNRFLAMALRLPLELQMALCQRAAGSAATLIKAATSEQAFRQLGRDLSLS